MLHVGIDGLVLALAGISAVLLAWGAWHAPHLARLSWRALTRQRFRSGVIIAGLMLTTILVEAAFVVNNTIVVAVKNVASAGVGRVDEEITGGTGALGLFIITDGDRAARALQRAPQVAGVAPALLIDDALAVDQTQRQVHGAFNLLGMEPDFAGPLGALQSQSGAAHALAAQAADEVWLNARAAEFLHAQVGDTLSSYSVHWAGKDLRLRVGAILADGPLGRRPTAFIRLDMLQTMIAAPSYVNRIYVANRGDPSQAVEQSAAITAQLHTLLPPGFQVHQVKADAITYALEAEQLFGRILGLYMLFALAVDVLLIFLIFALLVAERRSDLGTMRALGLRRDQIAVTLLIEAGLYNLMAAIPGALAGVGLGAAIIALINPAVAQLGFPLSPAIDPGSFWTALGLGFLFSLVITAIAIVRAARLPIANALRNLPDPPVAPHTLREIIARMAHHRRSPGALTEASVALLWGVTWRGLAPFAVGLGLFVRAAVTRNALLAALAWIILIASGALLARWLFLWLATARINGRPEAERLAAIDGAVRFADRAAALIVGLAIVLYWGLPGPIARYIAPQRFASGIEGFFIAGMLMVLGIELAAATNLGSLFRPLRALAWRFGQLRHVTAVGLAYPVQQRFRTGLSGTLFALVCFVMVVMASLANSTAQRYSDVGALTGGYDIIGQPLSHSVGTIDQVRATLAARVPGTAAHLGAISAAAALPLAIIEPTGQDAGWRLYPTSSIDGAFLQGKGLPLVARAAGYATDADVWATIRTHPGYAVIDAGALDPDQAAALGIQAPPAPQLERYAAPPIASTLLGPASLETALSRPQTQALLAQTTPEVRQLLQQPDRLLAYTLRLSNLLGPDGTFQPTTIWAADFRSPAPAQPLTIIGIVENAQGQRYGLLSAPATFATLEAGLAPIGNDYYYFGLTAGIDPQDAARDISAALLDDGFETTVIRQALLDLNAPEIFASQILLRLVGLMLLAGTAALMLAGLRDVVARRQQIGMLRALGFQRWHVQLVFVIETVLVALSGIIIGAVVGILLCRNGFDATFAAVAQGGLALIIPWGAIVIIACAALLAATLAVAIPAWQASRVSPAEALRYE